MHHYTTAWFNIQYLGCKQLDKRKAKYTNQLLYITLVNNVRTKVVQSWIMKTCCSDLRLDSSCRYGKNFFK